MMITEIIKAILMGIIEGITEWLPISSTGHMILADEFIRLGMSEAFVEVFLVVIQLGAILSVITLFWKRLFPFSFRPRLVVKVDTIKLWVKIVIACVPAAIIGFIFDDTINDLFFNYRTVSVALIFYGILFILIERHNKDGVVRYETTDDLDLKTALYIGLFQVLALVPGTSRSGATILGAILLGTSRTTAAEFSFFLAVPVMVGASILKIVKFGADFTGTEVMVLLSGAAAAFIVSLLTIRFLTAYVKKRDFSAFGWYRIILGCAVFMYFLFT